MVYSIKKHEVEVPAWFGPLLAIAQHRDKIRCAVWWQRWLHFIFVSWWCPCCIKGREVWR